MATEIPPTYWANDPQARLCIRDADQKLKNSILKKLTTKSPVNPDWPFGMPTSVNPWLVLVGVSPGAARGSKENVKSKRKEYEPSVGTAHQHFNSKPNWQKHSEWKGYWPKIRKLCVGLLHEQMGPAEENILSVCGHLNLGEKQNGKGDSKAINRKIVGWIPNVIAEQLRPEVVLLLGLNELIKNEALKSWKGSELDFILSEKPTEIVFKHSNTTTKRIFRVWNNPKAGAYPRKVIMLPNHPSRHPMTVPKAWDSMTFQLKKIVFAS